MLEGNKSMSKGGVVGALVALVVIVAVYVYQRAESPPIPSEGPERVSSKGLLSTERKIPSLTPQLSDRVMPQATDPSVMVTGAISGTARIHGTNAPAVGVSIRGFSGRSGGTLTQTDQKGSYTLAGLVVPAEGGRFSVIAEGEQSELFMLGFPVVVSVKPGEVKTGVNFILYQGRNGSIVGKVVGRRIALQKPDAISSQPTVLEFVKFEKAEDTPWPGVKVVLEGMNLPSQAPQGRVRKETYSDEQGSYRFDHLRPDFYTLWAERPEGAAMELGSPSQGNESSSRSVGLNPRGGVRVRSEPTTGVTFVFRRDGVSITGRVTDPNGNPIKGAKIVADLMISEGIPRRNIAGALSDADGRYWLRDLLPANLVTTFRYVAAARVDRKYDLHVQAEGYSPGHTTVIPVTDNTINDMLSLIEKSGGAGLYTQDELKSLVARSREIELKLKKGDLPKSKGDVITDADIVLQKEAVVAGRVLDTRGKPVSRPRGIHIVPTKSSSTQTDGVPPPKPIGSALDEGGRFSFKGVAAGIYLFQISNPPQNARDKILEVHAGETIENLELIVEAAEDRGDIAGLVLEAGSGKPIDVTGEFLAYGGMQHTRVEITKVDSPQEPTPACGKVTTFKSEKGVFLIEGVSPGSATLQLSPKGYVSTKRQMQVVSGQTTKGAFYLESRGAIAGRVLDAQTGNPITTITLKVVHVDSAIEKPASSGDVTLDQSRVGAFLIADISPGTATLEASAPGYGRHRAHVKVLSGFTAETILRLGSEKRLSVYITLNGKPQQAELTLRRQGDGPDFQLTDWTTETGRYEFKGLEGGDYWVKADFHCGGAPAGRRNDLARVKLQNPETRLDFGFLDDAGIRGTLTFPDREKRGRILILDSRRDASFSEGDRSCAQLWHISASPAAFEIRTLPPGTYTVVARCISKDGAFTQQSRAVTLTSGQVEQVDFVFP
jgi:protocatechuate 3,4-dioxygenase beta subunit